MSWGKYLTVFAFFAVSSISATGETYKCVIKGQSVISDTPCQAKAQRVDTSSDQITRDERRQAELVNARNQTQLSELEYRAAQERYSSRGVNTIDSMQRPTSSSSTSTRRR